MKKLIILALVLSSGSILAGGVNAAYPYESDSSLNENEIQSMENVSEEQAMRDHEYQAEEEPLRSSPIGGASAPREDSEENEFYR